jgi:hypothetical protein
MNIIEEPPKEFNYKNVIYWEPESRRLVRLSKLGDKQVATLLHKAQLFLELECIKKSGPNEYLCLPIKGYNKTTYKIEFKDNEWICNCQGYNSKLKSGEYANCSHIIAVKQWRFIKEHED